MNRSFPDLDWLDEGVAEIAPDGRFGECNTTMKGWLASAAHLRDLPLSPTDYERLMRGDLVDVRIGDGLRRLRLRTVGEERWLLASDVGAQRQLLMLERASARHRLLGGMSGSIVHDLANRMAAVIGFADHFGTMLAATEGDRLEAMVEAAQDSMSLLRTVVQMLERDPRKEVAGPLAGAVQQAVGLIDKHGRQQDRSIDLADMPESSSKVHVATTNALEVLTTALLFVLRTGRGALRVTVECSQAPRMSAVVRLDDQGDEASYRALALALESGDACPAFGRLGSAGRSLFKAALLLRGSGGDLDVEVGDGRRSLLLRWPEVSR